jgi:hypothetical protein
VSRAVACAWVPVLLVACATRLEDDRPCIEAGTAIGARAAECSGDSDLGVERVEQFEEEVVCRVPELASPEQQPDLYSCALSIRHLPCELALEYGDDLGRWLSTSPTCSLLVEP